MFQFKKALQSMLIPKNLKNQKGMSLVEILIVLAIIGALMSVLIPNVVSKLNKSKVENTKIGMGQVINALNMYYNDCGAFPATLEGLSKKDECSNWGPDPYLKKLPKDAWNHEYGYSVEGSNYTLLSMGADGKEGGDGFNKDLSSDDMN